MAPGQAAARKGDLEVAGADWGLEKGARLGKDRTRRQQGGGHRSSGRSISVRGTDEGDLHRTPPFAMQHLVPCPSSGFLAWRRCYSLRSAKSKDQEDLSDMSPVVSRSRCLSSGGWPSEVPATTLLRLKTEPPLLRFRESSYIQRRFPHLPKKTLNQSQHLS